MELEKTTSCLAGKYQITYYRKHNRCIKRTSDTTIIELRIPGKDQTLPVSHHPVTYPSKERLDQDIIRMEVVDSEVYESYLGDYFKGAEKNRKTYDEVRQKRFEQAKLSSNEGIHAK